MTVLFPKWTNKLPPVLAVASVAGGLFVVFAVWYWFSPWHLEVGYQPIQPVLYSHKLHADLLGMDCRYCHRMVEQGPHALVPDTATCMGCHAQVKGDSARLALVREKYESGDPLPWVRVHMLPDYAYFSHAAHLNAGVGCASCHGRIDQMEIVWQAKPLSMGWCLECHRNPENHLRPLDRITDMAFEVDPEEGMRLKNERDIHPPTHCSACHR